MEPVRIRDDVDPNSPEYKRGLRRVFLTLVVLMLTGGSCLGYRIRQMEDFEAARKEAEAAAEFEAESEGASTQGEPEQPGALSTDQKKPK